MNTIFINGKFFSQKITGVQRFGREALREIVASGISIKVLLPANAEVPNDLQGDNVEFIYVGKSKGYFWEQVTLPRFCKKYGYPLLNFANVAPILYKNNYVVIHDVCFKEKLPYIDKKWAFRNRVFVRGYIYKAKKIFTVSEFSGKSIKSFYPKLKNSPKIVYSGFEHVLRTEEERLEGINGEFYFSSSSVNPNKNFIYVLNLAKNNPDKKFVISGSANDDYTEFIIKNSIKNVTFTGYVSDGNLKWLYAHCTGFILPSFYEGFGLTPLEAIAAGCKKIYLSDIPVFREIYGRIAKFFDPNDYDNTITLNGEITASESDFTALTDKCSWKNVAKRIIEELPNENGG